jgi:LAO/AO transport system kinase
VGKSTLVNAITRHLRAEGHTVGILAVDPSSPMSGGALLGDRVRMSGHSGDAGVYIRSLASRGQLGGLSTAVPAATRALLAYGFTIVLIETVGVGQSEVAIARHADTTVVVSQPGVGDAIQAGKAGLLEIADVMVVNKADRDGARGTVRDLRDMLRMRRDPDATWEVPVIETRADSGEGLPELVHHLHRHLEVMDATGLLAGARAARAEEEFRTHAVTMLLAPLEAYIRDGAGGAVERVRHGKQTPSSAARELLTAIVKHGFERESPTAKEQGK